MIDFKGSQFEKEIIVWGVRWYVAYPISYRHLEERMQERGVNVDHATLNRWVIKYAPEVEKQCRRQQPVGKRWRMDETSVRIKGPWKDLYRAFDKESHTVDFLLTPHRDRAAAEAFLHKAIRAQGLPEKITIDQRGSNTAAMKVPVSQQHGRAGPSGSEAARASPVRIEIVWAWLLLDEHILV
jgi:transposase-like protein